MSRRCISVVILVVHLKHRAVIAIFMNILDAQHVIASCTLTFHYDRVKHFSPINTVIFNLFIYVFFHFSSFELF